MLKQRPHFCHEYHLRIGDQSESKMKTTELGGPPCLASSFDVPSARDAA